MSTSEKWQQNIAKAMNEIDHDEKKNKSPSVFYLPSWLPYVSCIVFGFFVADMMLSNRGEHPTNENRDYLSGGRAALLIVAEDIQSYWDVNGSLPKAAPTLADVLEVSYEKISDDHFRLSMPHLGSMIVFDGREQSFSME